MSFTDGQRTQEGRMSSCVLSIYQKSSQFFLLLGMISLPVLLVLLLLLFLYIDLVVFHFLFLLLFVRIVLFFFFFNDSHPLVRRTKPTSVRFFFPAEKYIYITVVFLHRYASTHLLPIYHRLSLKKKARASLCYVVQLTVV